jgi:hypothetical protein
VGKVVGLAAVLVVRVVVVGFLVTVPAAQDEPFPEKGFKQVVGSQ